MGMKGWVEKSKASVPCAYEFCGKVIETGEKVYVLKVREGILTYHWQCWSDLTDEWIKVRDTLQPDKGRKPLPLDGNQRKQRLAILRAYGTAKVRMKKYQHRLEADPLNVRLRLLVMQSRVRIELLKIEIAKVGGVPSKWLEEEVTESLGASQ